MVRLLTFFAVVAIVAALFFKSWKTAQPVQSGVMPNPSKPKTRPKRTALSEEFWMQVYDTDSMEDAKKIQRKFFDSDIPCFVYQQGKKDVYGDRMKHYGVSVPKDVTEKAQGLLAKIAL